MEALRERIDRLLEMDTAELGRQTPAEVEEVMQRGLAAIKSGELWVLHVRRALDKCGESDADRSTALQQELSHAEASLQSVRERVIQLCERARELGVGSPAPAGANGR